MIINVILGKPRVLKDSLFDFWLCLVSAPFLMPSSARSLRMSSLIASYPFPLVFIICPVLNGLPALF